MVQPQPYRHCRCRAATTISPSRSPLPPHHYHLHKITAAISTMTTTIPQHHSHKFTQAASTSASPAQKIPKQWQIHRDQLPNLHKSTILPDHVTINSPSCHDLHKSSTPQPATSHRRAQIQKIPKSEVMSPLWSRLQEEKIEERAAEAPLQWRISVVTIALVGHSVDLSVGEAMERERVTENIF